MYPLLNIDDTYSASSDIAKEIFEELAPMLWPYRTPLMRSIDLPTMRLLLILNMGVLLFVDGLGGTRKTNLYKAQLATIHNQSKIVVAI